MRSDPLQTPERQVIQLLKAHRTDSIVLGDISGLINLIFAVVWQRSWSEFLDLMQLRLFKRVLKNLSSTKELMVL